jgi:hypothetical protein
MLEDALIEELNRGYVCPPDAGPAWRAACDYGFDMSLVEDALRMTAEQPLEQHQRALNGVISLMDAPASHASEWQCLRRDAGAIRSLNRKSEI